jgi:HK97 family phage major capsid protein
MSLETIQAQLKAIEATRTHMGPVLADMVSNRLAKLAEVQRTNMPGLPPSNPQSVTDDEVIKNGAARCIQLLYAAKGDAQRAIAMAEDGGQKALAGLWAEALELQNTMKAMGQDTLAGGGAMLPPTFMDEIIIELGAKAVVRSMGLTTVPMNGSLTLPYVDQSATASYVGEAQNATESTPTTAQMQLNEKTLIALGVMSNQLLQNGSPRTLQFLQDHLIRVLKRKEDITFIRSLGTANEPTGMLYLGTAANRAANQFAANATINVANVTVDLGKAINALMTNDVDLDMGVGWIFAPRTYQYLNTARDGNNNLVWAPDLARGLLMGYPYKITSQIPVNLGGGTNESEVYFASFKDLVLGESELLEVDVFPNGAYHDGSAVVSGISTNQTPVRCIARHDLGAQYQGREISVITGVKWGT